MSSALEVVWSAAMERAGTATFAKDGLSSPLIGSTAKLGMAVGSNANIDRPLAVPPRKKKRAVCFSCGSKFDRTYLERVCAPCFVRLHAARRFER